MYEQAPTGWQRLYDAFSVATKVASVLVLLACSVILIAWVAGCLFTDQYAWSQWLWWIPTPVAIVAAAIALIIALIPGRSRVRWIVHSSIWVTVCAVLLIYFAMFEHRLLHEPTPRNPATTIRIVHLNASRGFDPGTPRVAAILLDLDPDVVLYTYDARTARDLVTTESLGGGYHRVGLWPYTLLSQLPIVETRHIVARSEITLALTVLQRPDGRQINIYLIDLPSDPKLARMDIAERVRALLADAEAPPPDLVIGDFNITRGSASLQYMFPDLLHAFDTAGRGYGASFPARPALLHIDHTLHRSDVEVAQYFIHDGRIGQHHMQVIDISR